jgi:hypothetical protein
LKGEEAMTINYDEKGKLYTDIVLKEAVPVRIQTTSHYIEGSIHIREEFRLKDELDQPEPFLAITNAKVYSPDRQLIFSTSFIAIRREHIIWAISVHDQSDEVKG